MQKNYIWKEIDACRNDFVYFVETYVKIFHPVKGLQSFVLHPYQKRIIQDYENNRLCICKKFRQGGFTTLTTFYALWKCLFQDDQHIMIGAKTDREAMHIGNIVSLALNHFPKWIKHMFGSNTNHHKNFPLTNSCLFFGNLNAGIGRSLSLLIIDEAAFIPQMDGHWNTICPCLQQNGHCIVLSTVNGIGNWFEQTHTDAEKKVNQFHIIDAEYWEHPDYNDEEWVRKTREFLGEKRWQQEVLCNFCCDYVDEHPHHDLLMRLSEMKGRLTNEGNASDMYIKTLGEAISIVSRAEK